MVMIVLEVYSFVVASNNHKLQEIDDLGYLGNFYLLHFGHKTWTPLQFMVSDYRSRL